ncbi:MAG: DUF1778 domain-containing protein [Candidatus Korobacteraceae bacterium]|jgi:uncharacterized protein (DUF1778 family)
MTQALLERKSERIDARLTPEEKQTIETAARLRGTTVRDFVVLSAKEAAVRTIRENEILTLAGRSRRIFVEALLQSPRPNRKALTAARRFNRENG